MARSCKRLVAALIGVLGTVGAAGAVDVPTRDVLLSRGETGEIADVTGTRRLKNQYAYIFPGAKLVRVRNQPQGLARGEILAHTENGLLVVVELENTLNVADLRRLRAAEVTEVAFITENTGFVLRDGDHEMVIGLGRRELYPIVGHDDFKLTIRVDVCARSGSKPSRCTDPSASRTVDVRVDKERLGFVDLAQFDRPTIAFTGPMRQPVRSAVEGVTKRCREKVVRTLEAGGKIGLNVEAYFFDIGVNGKAESQFVQSFPEDVQVDFRYYTRDDGVLRRFITEQPCSGAGRELRFLVSKGPDASNDLDAIVEAGFWKGLGLDTDPSTQKPRVRCAAQYWRLFTELVRMEVEERDAAFFLARMVTLRDFDDADCLEATRARDTPSAGAASAPAPAG